MVVLYGFTEETFSYAGQARTVYRHGEGPGVIVMPEMPGITPEVARFALRVADEGFTVFVPNLFGTAGRALSAGAMLATLKEVCVSREFSLLASGQASAITEWLRALCRHVHGELGGKGVGAIGMCLTGNFALSLMVDPVVMAPVLAQPSLPLPVTKSRRGALHLSARELDVVKERANGGCSVLGLRFTADPLCPPERFRELRAELGRGFEGIEIDSAPGNPHGISRTAHSVVTNDLVDRAGHPTREALDRVLAFLAERLK
jgi:dienelactone hydrolase